MVLLRIINEVDEGSGHDDESQSAASRRQIRSGKERAQRVKKLRTQQGERKCYSER